MFETTIIHFLNSIRENMLIFKNKPERIYCFVWVFQVSTLTVVFHPLDVFERLIVPFHKRIFRSEFTLKLFLSVSLLSHDLLIK